MVRIWLSLAAALAACTPSPQETAMPKTSPESGSTAQGSSAGSEGQASGAPNPIGRGAGNRGPAARADSPAEARGRRTLSTAFVMVGPDGHLTVELGNGRVLILRDVVMRPRDYCGVQLPGGARYCGGYAEVAAARPGGAPAPGEPYLAVSHPVESPRRPAKRN
jgi:hypothetical protein